jgi:hypothetical protein
VVPIVAVHGAQVPWGKVVVSGVPVVSARQLPSMLRALPAVLKPERVAELADQARVRFHAAAWPLRLPGWRSTLLLVALVLQPRAISEQLSVLDLARIHHGVLLDVLKTHRSPQELEHIAQAASEFLVEALAVFEMTQRGFTELLSTLRSDQEQPSAEDQR